MKKTLPLALLLLSIGFLTVAQATPVKIYSTDLVSGLSVALGGGTDFKTLHAGEFKFVLNPGTAHAYETISYCIDPYQYFNPGSQYDYTILPVDLYGNDKIFGAAFLMNEYAVAFNKTSALTGPYSNEDIAGGLQLAIWDTLISDITINTAQTGMIYNVYSSIMQAFDKQQDKLSDNFFVALSDTRQDQLFKQPAPVPEPTSMMLMGIGLLGLGIVGRKRLK